MRNIEVGSLNQIANTDLTAIERVVGAFPSGASAQQIISALAEPPALRTLQYRLKYLVEHGRLVKLGKGGGRNISCKPKRFRPI